MSDLSHPNPPPEEQLRKFRSHQRQHREVKSES